MVKLTKLNEIQNYYKKNKKTLIQICEEEDEDYIINFINKNFTTCNPSSFNKDGSTPFMIAINNEHEDVALKLIDKFGDKCNPNHINKNTALILASEYNLDDVVFKMIEIFGDTCKP